MILFSFDIFIAELKKAKYSAKVGSIIYIIVKTYTNIIFTISMINKFTKNFNLKYFHIIN